MGRYLGKCNCKGVVGEIAVVGVRTRDRDHILAMATPSSPRKRIKKAPVATTMPYDVHELTNRRLVPLTPVDHCDSSTCCRPEASLTSDVVVVFTATNCSSEFPAASSSSSNDASSLGEFVKDRLEVIADPEVESAMTSSKYLGCRISTWRENKVGALKSDDLDSPPRHPDAKSTVQIKMPSDTEIEEFFTEAEKDLHKRFTEKYNFDIVKDVPLEGRYDWAPLQ